MDGGEAGPVVEAMEPDTKMTTLLAGGGLGRGLIVGGAGLDEGEGTGEGESEEVGEALGEDVDGVEGGGGG